MNFRATLLLLAVGIASCQRSGQSEQPSIAFIHASIIDPATGNVQADGTMLVRSGRIVAVGASSEVEIPAGADVTDLVGKFVVPGLINAHGHVGDVKGIEGGQYSRENVVDNLWMYASYGVTTVVSLGGDRKEAAALRAVLDSFPSNHARLYIAGTVITGVTPADALPVIDSNRNMGVDFMKIRVDDNLGTAPKMSEEVYTAVIERSHELGYKIATHMYYLDDARKLLKAGSDLMAHSVRDKPVDEEFISLIRERKVCYCPTLTRELSTYVYGDTPEFFTDPFFTRMYDSVTIAPLKDPVRQAQVREGRNGKIYRQQLPVAMSNLKRMIDEQIPVAFGTDSGIPTRFIGYFEHLEMQLMADAGLSPLQILKSATTDAAACLELKGVGALAPGYWADFVVLSADPLVDIRNMKRIDAVYIGARQVQLSR